MMERRPLEPTDLQYAAAKKAGGFDNVETNDARVWKRKGVKSQVAQNFI